MILAPANRKNRRYCHLPQVRVLPDHYPMSRQIALAWLLAQYQQISPIPGTRRRERLEENTGATRVALSADDIADLNAAAAAIGVHGNRYNDHHMSLVGR
jgi:aryl-alcohol dehydrogenase-like predicted oxidoreductase